MPNFPAVDDTGAFINPDVLARLDERIGSAAPSLTGTDDTLLAVGRWNTTGAVQSSATTDGYVPAWIEPVTITVDAPVTVLMEGDIYGYADNGADLCFEASSDGGTTWTVLDPYKHPSYVMPSWVKAASKTRFASGSWVVFPGPRATLELAAGIWTFRARKYQSGTARFAENAGFYTVVALAAVEGSGSGGGGAAQAGTLVWRGEWAAGSYPVGAVVRHDRQLWTARVATALPPAHPAGDAAGMTESFTGGKPTTAAWFYVDAGGGVSVTTDLTSGSLGTPPPAATHALQLKASPAGGVTTATLTISAPAPGTLTFWEAISAEGGAYDYGSFLLDGVLQGTTVAPDASRVIGWRQRTVALSTGSRTLTWRYQKDASQDHGRDAYFITNITVTYPQDWEPFTPAHLAGAGSGGGGGAGQPGTMVWKGAWGPAVGYAYGDVVTYDRMLWVAKDTTLGTIPALPGLAFNDDFNRPDGTIGQYWDIQSPVWTVTGGKAATNSGTAANLVRSGLGTDGTLTVTHGTNAHPWNESGVIFGYTDSQNYYCYNMRFAAIQRVSAGAVTTLGTVLNSVNQPNTGGFDSLLITKDGGTISVVLVRNGSTSTLTVTDDAPLTGTGWGLRHAPTSSLYPVTTFDNFTYTPPTTSPWNVLERRWTTTSLDDVFAPTVLDGQQLVYNGPAARWEPRTISTNSVAAVVHGGDATVARPQAVSVHWYGSVAPLNAQPRDEWIEEQA